MQADVRVRVASREPRHAHFIQPLGQIGQWGLVRADVTRARMMVKAVR
jgi:NADH dehydrogenase